jgi:membrane fusion protein (multidrug efflux system)
MPTQTEHENNEQPAASQADEVAKSNQVAPPDPKKRRRGMVIGGIVLLALLVGGISWWLHSETLEDTDDAQVDGHLNPIAARIGGTISAVYVEDNQHVKAGQPVVDLDPRDAEVNLAQAQADYEEALAQVGAEAPNVPIQKTSNQSDVSTSDAEVVNADAALQAARHDYDSDVAKLRQAEAINQKSQSDLVRYKQLVDKRELAQSEYDEYVSAAASNAANVDAANAAVASQKKLIEQRQAQLRQQETKRSETVANGPRQIEIKAANSRMRQANLKSSEAKLEQAKLNLAYCHVVAPVDGIVMQRSAELGGRVSQGQQLLMIAQVDAPWVVANFKETQVRKMRPGQSVDITVDALGKAFTGTVEAMPASTGDRASLLPAENATGNYVKVIQRLPVRIHFNSGQAGLDEVRPGMSVEPKVHLY